MIITVQAGVSMTVKDGSSQLLKSGWEFFLFPHKNKNEAVATMAQKGRMKRLASASICI